MADQPRLPDWIQGINGGSGRVSASRINEYARTPRERSITIAGEGTLLPIVYGRCYVAGRMIASGFNGSNLVLAYAFCVGECDAVENVYINDEVPPAGVTVTTYTGTTSQGVDPTLAASIPAYADTNRIPVSGGFVGVCYAVIEIEPSALDGFPRSVAAVIRGRKVLDPRVVPNQYQSAQRWRVYFTDASSTDTYLLDIAEIEMRDGIGGTDLTSGGTVDASSSNPSFPAVNAFDGSTATRWVTATGEVAPQWIEYDFGSSVTIREVAITTFSADRVPVDFEIQYFNGGTWIPVASVTGESGWGSLVTKAYAVDAIPEVGYSDNPALCIADLITDPDIGLGIAASGVEDCADWCDSLLGGVIPRARCALVIENATAIAPNWLDVFAEYAECWWIPDGDGIKLIPDQAVDLTGAYEYGGHNIIAGSLTLAGADQTDTPTEVEVRYTEPTSSGEPWRTKSVVRSLTGVSSGAVNRIPTTVSLEGLYREPDASNKALARLNKMQNRITAEWVTTDAGVVNQRGDVVVINHAERGVNMPVIITNVGMAGAGRWRVSAIRYDSNHYPSELPLPEGVGIVPDGVVAVLTGDNVPAGWTEITGDVTGLIRGKMSAPLGSTLGTNATSLSYTTDPDGGHNAADVDGTSESFLVPFPGNTFVSTNSTVFEVSDQSVPDHTHDVDIGFSVRPYTSEIRLVEKDGNGLEMPQEIVAFGIDGLTNSEISIYSSAEGDFIGANFDTSGTRVVDGVTTSIPPTSSTVSTVNYRHSHFGAVFGRNYEYNSSFDSVTNYRYERGGSTTHAHSASIQAALELKYKKLPLWGSFDNWSVVPGIIFMWRGDPTALPTDYVLCDGLNNTPDLSGYFVKTAPVVDDVSPFADNLIVGSVNLSNYSHEHRGTSVFTGFQAGHYVGHEGLHTHNHGSKLFSEPYAPDVYDIAFIMYAPGV